MPYSTYLPEHMGTAVLTPPGPFVAGSHAELVHPLHEQVGDRGALVLIQLGEGHHDVPVVHSLDFQHTGDMRPLGATARLEQLDDVSGEDHVPASASGSLNEKT